jgi:hypothetical protein
MTAADDVRFGDSISISPSVAALLVDVITLAEKLLCRQNGQPLSPKARSIRSDLKGCLARAAANADVSTEALGTQSVLAFEKSPEAAAEILGIKPGSVRYACRAGRIGRKVGDRWLITDAEIEMYARTYRRGVA